MLLKRILLVIYYVINHVTTMHEIKKYLSSSLPTELFGNHTHQSHHEKNQKGVGYHNDPKLATPINHVI